MTKTRPTIDGFTYPQRRILGAVMDLFDTGSSVVTVSDVYTRLASESPPVSEREIRTQLDVLSPTYVTQVRPEVRLHAAAWSKMKRVPVPAPARAPSTPIEQAVVAQPVPIAAPVVAPALREKPATPVRRPSAPLSLEPRGSKMAEVRPVAAKIEVVQRFEVGDPEAFKHAIGASPEALDALEGSKSATDAPPVFVDAPLEAAPVAPPQPEPTLGEALREIANRPAPFPRREHETMVDLAIRYLQARGAQGATAAEAQSDTDVDLGTTFSDITRRGRAVGVGNGSRHNGKNAAGDPLRRRWYALDFAPEGVGPVVLPPKVERVVVEGAVSGHVAAYGGASTPVVRPELVAPDPTVDQKRIAEQLADVTAERDRLRQQLRDFNEAHDEDTARWRQALGIGHKATWGELLDIAAQMVKQRDDATGPAWGAAARQAMEETATLRQVLAPAEGQTLEDRARELNTQIAATWFHLGAGKEGQTIDERAAEWVKQAQDDQNKAVARARTDEYMERAFDLANAIDVRPDTPFDRSIGCVVDIHRAVDHALHVLSSNLPTNAPPVEAGDETTGPMSTADELVMMADAAANALASTPAPDFIADIRRSVVGDLARALNVQVEHTDPSEAYYWLLEVAQNRVPLDLGIDLLIERELTKHEARMKALRVAHAIAKASS